MPLIRYPGSKEKLASELFQLFPDSFRMSLWSSMSQCEYREPFFGAGAIGIKILDCIGRNSKVWINDLDSDLVCMWKAVKDSPREICRHIARFKPSVDKFFEFKERDGKEDCEIPERGFRKLALHRMSVSGFGVKSGGPIGGKNQNTSLYTVGCRWNPERIKRDVFRINSKLNKFTELRITCGDFQPLLENTTQNCFIYLDPPYYKMGGQLYKHSMPDTEHERLAGCLKSISVPWVLSYDEHPRIRELYSWANFCELHITYTNAVTNKLRPKNKEVAIFPQQ